MFNIDCDGETWTYSFVDPDAVLSNDDRQHLIRESIRMFRDGKRKVTLRGADYEGVIKRGKHYVLSGVRGQLSLAKLETDRGKTCAAIALRKIDYSFEPELN